MVKNLLQSSYVLGWQQWSFKLWSLPPKGFLWTCLPLTSRSIKGNFLHVKFIFNLTWLINMIALSILRIHNYTTIQWHFILCTVNPSYDCSQVIRELWYVIMQLVHLAGQSSMHNIRNRQPKTQIWHHPEQNQYQVDIGVSLYNILA
jgi:hypothetical protein